LYKKFPLYACLINNFPGVMKYFGLRNIVDLAFPEKPSRDCSKPGFFACTLEAALRDSHHLCPGN
jgi:hypothetical protein